MNIIIACERSGIIRDAMMQAGHSAWSCDLQPGAGHNVHRHIQDDIRNVLNDTRGYTLRTGKTVYPNYWHMLIAHPDCTYLTNSAEWAYADQPMINGKPRNLKPGTLIGAERRQARAEAVAFVMWLANQPIHYIAIENPVGALSRLWRKPNQYIQPYDYGDDASKNTCLWLKNLPPLIPTERIDPRLVCCGQVITARYGCPDCCGDKTPRPRWANQTDSGQNRLPPGKHRARDRAETYQGWADAMADQWPGDWNITNR